MIWIYLLIILGLLILINLYFRWRTYRSLEKDLDKLNWNKLSKKQYILKCYHFISDRFGMVRHCWMRIPWRNLFYRNLWRMKGKALPCHHFALLFNRAIHKRFPKMPTRLKYTNDLKQLLLVHFHSQIKPGRKWIDVDVWGKKRNVPFGKSINSEGWVR